MEIGRSSAIYIHVQAMFSVNSVFDKVYLINLERDSKKYEIMKAKLDSLGIKFELFKAIDGSQLKTRKRLRFGNMGAVGCKMSHMSIIRQAKHQGLSRILVLEDDLNFWNDFNQRFDEVYSELLKMDKSWKLLYLGASNRPGRLHIRLDIGGAVQLLGSRFITGAYAIGYDSSVYDTIIRGEHDDRPYDDIVGNDVNEGNYIVYPYLAYPDINKPSNTVDNNGKNQIEYNKMNYIDASKYC
jgi:hypothetical protein